MIDQGTNGLSRDIWLSALQGLQDSQELTQAVFDPLCFDPLLVDSYVSCFCLATQYAYCHWDSVWDARHYFHKLTVWSLPLEIARQVITFMLESWSECPLTKSSLFFVPRMLLYWSNPVSQVLRAMASKRTTRGRSNFGELMTVKIS
jgi:hypothetical protein